MPEIVYLDNNATTMVSPEVFDAMVPYLHACYGNPSSMHVKGEEANRALNTARKQAAAFLGAADPVEITFTGSGTESDNLAVQGTLLAYPDKKHIVTSAVEHPAVYEQCLEMKRRGYDITILPVNEQGMLDIDEYRKALRPDTAIVSIMWANNETGVVFPVEQLAAIAHERGIVFHTDAVQAAGKIPVDMSRSCIDLLSIAGHKLHASKGIGILYIRKGTKLRPVLIGGHQERGRRPGTENLAAIAGLGVACELARNHITVECGHIGRLRDKLERGILEKIPKVRINGHPQQRLPNTVNISFEYIEGESILLLLNERGICASSGSACTSGSLEPSHVLKAMKVPVMALAGAIRFSMSRYNTEADIDFTLSALPAIIEKLRTISPYWKP